MKSNIKVDITTQHSNVIPLGKSPHFQAIHTTVECRSLLYATKYQQGTASHTACILTVSTEYDI